MYFALGQVSGANFHALFDRPTDTGSKLIDLEIVVKGVFSESVK